MALVAGFFKDLIESAKPCARGKKSANGIANVLACLLAGRQSGADPLASPPRFEPASAPFAALRLRLAAMRHRCYILYFQPVPFSPAASLGRYEIIEPLGAGGMCEVHRARDTRLHGLAPRGLSAL